MVPEVNSKRFEISNRFEIPFHLHDNLHRDFTAATFQTSKKRPQEKTKLLTLDVIKENNVAASLFHPILVTLTSICLLEMMLKTDNGSKKTENSRLAYDEVQVDTLPLAKIKTLMKINLVLLDDTVNRMVISPGETYS